ncbi:cell envelope integrity protein CreD [Cognatilysobacter lacus]|uniref:Cell envelope integrity protein CreD n=1 Tax=Cognatilysobacter lacus TaxID=1643323 RepID=A0A5D8Z9X4_9GAMM|nr:cell envelope integrity protein CreD [Lysobacter lacus]TZF91725.1 cell envelope integrity protein CreD [Lysobacter lacus]
MRMWFKMVLVAAMTLAILIPLALVHGVTAERQSYRRQAVADVMRSYAGPQAVTGPVLTVPYSEIAEFDEPGGDGVAHTVRKRRWSQWTFFPTRLAAGGPLVPATRKRGIYAVPVYEWTATLAAEFDATIPDDAAPGAERVIGVPVLSYAITDVRGLHGAPRLRVDGVEMELHEGSGIRAGSGLHARLAALAPGAHLALATRLDMQLAGAESLGIVPIAKRNRIDLVSSWPHPSFQGLSPWRSRITDGGFRAQWQVASVATDAQRQFLGGAVALPFAGTDTGNATGGIDVLGVVLAEPVDAYTQADRATKYGVLFVVLTFVGLFMFELVRQLPIHPIQYGLVGLALVIFFLLLVSLGEHVDFGVAYVVASGACIGLIGFYLSAVLRSAARGGAFAAMLALLYGALYGLLISEDNALVLGAGLLFAILAGIMTVTRRVDWYRLGAPATPGTRE